MNYSKLQLSAIREAQSQVITTAVILVSSHWQNTLAIINQYVSYFLAG